MATHQLLTPRTAVHTVSRRYPSTTWREFQNGDPLTICDSTGFSLPKAASTQSTPKEKLCGSGSRTAENDCCSTCRMT